jgi:RNA polymerase sigma factor (sigma-70 family)
MTDAPTFDGADVVRIGHDVAALEQFYRAHFDDVLRYLTRRAGEPQDVADLVADTFLAAMGSAHTFDHRRGRALPWLIGIAHNQLRRFQRRRWYERRTTEQVSGQRLLDPDDIAEITERIALADQGARARGLLDRLTPQQRELVELVDIEGFTPAEIANVLGISAGSARIRLYRARTALRQAYLHGEEPT